MKKLILICSFAIGISLSMNSQEAVIFGSAFVSENANAVFYEGNISLVKLGSNLQSGHLGTERGYNKGFVGFTGTAVPIGVSDTSYIDGYVKSYKSSPFIFPIGDNGQYRPIAVTYASSSNPVSAAYFGASPALVGTPRLKSGLKPFLATEAPFSLTRVSGEITRIDPTGYWDIDGRIPTKISLSWSSVNQVKTLVNHDLNSLAIVGWDGTKWVEIPSVKDAISIWGSPTTLSQGSMTSRSSIVPSDFIAFALATKSMKFRVQNSDTSLMTKSTVSIGPSVSAPIGMTLTNNLIGPKNGTASISSSGVVTYTPPSNYIGIDTIYRIICLDGGNLCDTSLIEITTIPNAKTTYLTTIGSEVLTLGSPIQTSRGTTYKIDKLSKNRINGQLTLKPDGTAIYKPNLGFSGLDTIRIILNISYSNETMRCDTLVTIISVQGDLIIQNYISPNGDGINDNWVLPSYLYDRYPNLKAIIYNRLGSIVWRSTGKYTNNWHGQIEGSGNIVSDGVYYYLLELNSEFKEIKSGFIEVMRH